MLKTYSLLILSAFFLSSCAFAFIEKTPKVEGAISQTYQSAGYSVHARSVPTPNVPAVLFIHGTPGNGMAWNEYLADPVLREKSFMIAVDRPGFGTSEIEGTHVDLPKQAQAIIETARQIHPGPFIVVGHSYGGVVQTQLAIDYPDDISRMIVMASPYDPEVHNPRWYHRLGHTWVGKRALPASLKRANFEMMGLKDTLISQEPHLNKITTPFVLVQGQGDYLVPRANADYAAERILNTDLEIIHLPNQGHFLPWQQFPLMRDLILKAIKLQG